MRRRTALLLLILLPFGYLTVRHLYLFHNKYQNSQYPDIICLSEGLLYPDRLLSPKEINRYEGIPVTTGTIQNLSAFHADKTGFGKMSMVFTYTTNQPEIKQLYIQEVFSAAKIYINGSLVAQSGSFTPYSESIQDFFITFQEEKENNVLIQCENRSHYYTGIQYPAIIGKETAIIQLLGKRLLLYALFAISSLTLAGYTAILWLRERKISCNRLPFYFGMMAFCFGIYACYPFFPFFHLPVNEFLYALQDTCMSAILYFACLSIFHLQADTISIKKLVLPFSLILISFLAPFLLPFLPAFIQPYGWILSFCRLLMACYMLLQCTAVIKQQKEGKAVLCGLLIYTALLVIHILTMNRFEPLDGAWFEEYGVYLLIFFFAWMMITRTSALQEHDRLLSTQLQEEVDRQTLQISSLLNERRSLLSELLHDVKKPVASAMSYLEMMRDEKTEQQLKQDLSRLQENYRFMSEQLQMLQSFNEQDHIPLIKKPLDFCQFLLQIQALYAPDALAYDVDFHFSTDCKSCMLYADSIQLKRMIQNLFFNALSYAPAHSIITMTLEKENHLAVLQFTNQGEIIPEDKLQHIFERGFTTRHKEGSGLGLFIVHTIVILHQGTIQVHSENKHGTCFTIQLPLLEE